MKFEFEAEIWMWPSDAAWYFVTVPKEYTQPIKQLGESSKGFGSVKVEAIIKDALWQTSIFPDKKSGCYLLPIKKEIRKIHNIKEGMLLSITIQVVGT